MEVLCEEPVVLLEDLGSSETKKSPLSEVLALKKEYGNARLVSGDVTMWVLNAELTRQVIKRKGCFTPKEDEINEFRVTSGGKRALQFQLVMSKENELFIQELNDQIHGKTKIEIRKKKRKIRKKMEHDQAAGFVPVNTLKSPIKKLPLTPTKSHNVANTPTGMNVPPKSPRPTPSKNKLMPPSKPIGPLSISISSPSGLPIPVISETNTKSPIRSPFRSPFRKKREGRTYSSPGLPPLGQSKWLSPVPSMNVRNSSEKNPLVIPTRTPVTAPNSVDKENALPSPSSSTRSPGIVNRRARSLQQILDDVPIDSQNQKVPPTTQAETAVSVSSPSPPPHKIYGLLNLGNYCYMNAVVQAMASLEEFVKLLESEDWLLKVIRKQLGLSQVSQIEKAIEEWKQEETNKSHLILTRCLQNLFKQLIQGSEHPINPESLKSIMGKKNSIFATHFQQDAHEFLLNLVNEYEKECLFMVQGVLQKLQHFQVPCTITTTSSTHHSSKSISSKIASQTATKPEGLLKYFASVSAPKESSTESPSGKSLVSQLLPARTFRTDVYRSLTCESCGYSRRQVETFYDFSVDLPFYSESQLNRNRSPVEPNISPTPVNKANASSIQCYCEFEAVLSGMEGESTTSAYYHCPKNACSFRLEKSKLEEKKNKDAEAANEFDETSKDTNQEKVVLKQDQQQHQQPQSIKSYFGSASTHPSNDTCTSSSSFSFPSVKLEDLIKKQFEPVRLELKCEKCSEGKQALAAYEVDSIPSVLVLHLKRFEMNPHTGTFHKRCDPVHIPLTLDPVQLINEQNNKEEATISTKTISTPIEKDVYELKSIVHHMGKNIDEGHYVTDLLYPLYPEKENTNKKNILWKRRNDSVETLISQELALQGKSMQSCYILLYVKKKKPNQMQKELHLCRMAVENIKKKSPLTHSKTQKTIQEEENVSIQNDHILQIH